MTGDIIAEIRIPGGVVLALRMSPSLEVEVYSSGPIGDQEAYDLAKVASEMWRQALEVMPNSEADQ